MDKFSWACGGGVETYGILKVDKRERQQRGGMLAVLFSSGCIFLGGEGVLHFCWVTHGRIRGGFSPVLVKDALVGTLVA